jgi:hypothetical protein
MLHGGAVGTGQGVHKAPVDESAAFDLQVSGQRLPIRRGNVEHGSPRILG